MDDTVKLETFDIFDTVLVRCVDAPRHVFDLVARKLGWPSFPAARVAAERRARRELGHGEPTLEEICSRLQGLPPGVTAGDAAAMEIEVEQRVWRVVEAARVEVRRARTAGSTIGFLSDMYLPSAVLSAWLVREGVAEPSDPVWVSCELRCSKHTGSAYGEVRRRLGGVTEWVHWGDNARADVQRAARAGVAGRLWRSTEWSAAESRWSALAPGAGSCVRAARLSGVEEVGRAVAGPAVVLAAFVQGAVEGARRAGLGRLYFLARDGQVLARMAAEFVKRGPAIDVRYLLASRRAWRLAAFGADGQGLDQIASLALEAGELPEFLLPPGDAARPPATWDEVPSWLEAHRPRIEFHARAQAEAARRHLGSAGLLDGGPVGLVDLGWSGTLQQCLGRMRRAWGCPEPVSGWYLSCLINGGPYMHSFLHPPGRPAPRFVHAASAWEMLCGADHGTLLGYLAPGEALLARMHAEDAARTRVVQEAMVRVAANLVASGCTLPSAEVCRRWSRSWLGAPHPGDLGLLRGGYTTRALAAHPSGPAVLRPRRLARLLLTRHRHLEEWPWPGAALSASVPWCPAWIRTSILTLREAAWDWFAGPRAEISRLRPPATPVERPV